MIGEEKKYQELFKELEEFEEYGIYMQLEGKPASPMQIVEAHMVRESGAYMRDYVLNPDGYVKELCFYDVNSKL